MIFNFIGKSLGRAARLAFTSVAAVALVSCGGGGGSAGTVANSTGGTTAASLQMTFSSNQINSTSTTPVTITITALSANNVAVANVAVQIASDTGVITQAVNPALTNASGQVTATLSVGSNTNPRTIHVTATGGGQTATGSLQVIGTTGQPTIALLFSSPTIASANTGTVTVTAQVEDSNNNALSGVPVSFTATSGVLTVTQATSSTSGLATATLGTAGNPSNRAITVTATGGGATTSSTIQVTGTTLAASSAPSSLTQGTMQKYSFTLQDSGGNGIPNAPVTFKSAAGNTVVADSSDAGTSAVPLTNGSGVVVLDVTPTVAGQDTLTVSADGASANASFNVTSQSLSVTLADITTNPPTIVSVSPQPLSEYTSTSCIAVNASYTVNGVGASGSAAVTTSRGNLYLNAACTAPFPANGANAAQTATINSVGQMQTLYLKSTTAGTAVVTVSELSGNVTGPTQSASVAFIAQLTSAYTPSITLTASPNLVAPNTTSSPNANFSSIIATVRDGSPQNNLVQGAQVQFTVVTDASGGSVSPSVVTTQANGQAVATYYPGSGTTPANGVTITAKIQGAITASNTVNLTVSGTSLFVTLGTGNTINVVNDTSFSQDWTAYVTDSNGNPVSNATVTGQLVALYYSKGTMIFGKSWAPNPATQPTDGYNYPVITSGGPWCPNTDVNNDGVYDLGDIAIYYPNSTTIWPYVMPGIPGNVTSSGTTNSSGFATITVSYPQDHAMWTIVQLTVNAATTGTQSTASTSFMLNGPAASYASQTVAPPGQTSPYGVNNCATAF